MNSIMGGTSHTIHCIESEKFDRAKSLVVKFHENLALFQRKTDNFVKAIGEISTGMTQKKIRSVNAEN